jgi:hypothetical protein
MGGEMRRLLTIIACTLSLIAGAEKFYPGTGQVCWVAGATSGFCSAPPTLGAGDTIVLQGGVTYSTIALIGYRGTPQAPIVITNEGGIAYLSGIELSSCHYVLLKGNDVGGQKGIRFDQAWYPNGNIVHITGRSKCIEVRSIFGKRAAVLIKAKQDISCTDSLLYPNWVMDSIWAIDCEAEDITQDAMYFDTTIPNGDFLGCGQVYPMRSNHIRIIGCVFRRVYRTTIQVSISMGGEIAYNIIEGAGYELNPVQGVGIALGDHTFGMRVHHNTISYTYLEGIRNFGKGRNFIDSNTISYSGFLYFQPGTNIDSIARRCDTALAYGANGRDDFPEDIDPGYNDDNEAWMKDGKTFKVVGQTLVNTYYQPAAIALTPGPDRLRYPTLDSSTSIVKGNRIGPTAVVDAGYNYIGGNVSVIRWLDYNYQSAPNYNPTGYFNYSFDNKLLDGETTADLVKTPSVNVFTLNYTAIPAYGGTESMYPWRATGGPPVTVVPRPLKLIRLPRPGRIRRS